MDSIAGGKKGLNLYLFVLSQHARQCRHPVPKSINETFPKVGRIVVLRVKGRDTDEWMQFG